MNTQIILGNNINKLLNHNRITKEQFASCLGYSAEDVDRLIEGRLYVDNEEIKDISNFLQVQVEQLFIDNCHYNDTVIDLFDIACDIEEALNTIKA